MKMSPRAVHCGIALPSLLLSLVLASCDPTASNAADESTYISGAMAADARIGFLHHSTGGVIWGGGVESWLATYNAGHATSYAISQTAYPDGTLYPWANYPWDYWNIWVKNAGDSAYSGQSTLEMLTKDYELIVFKHCFPVSNVGPDTGSPDITSATKSTENYKLQYNALKTKLNSFPSNRFLVWTGAALIEGATDSAEAARARDFFAWVRDTWDVKGDNIFVWDFWTLETDGGLYLTAEHATSDSHPNSTFAAEVAPYFCQRVIDVLAGTGDTSSVTGR